MKPSLDHAIEITDLTGTSYRWSQEERNSWDIPAGAQWASRREDGYAEATFTLQRPITRDFPDLSLLNEVTVTGADGTVVYSGRISAFPRSSSPSQGEFFNVTANGWMTHATDRTFQEIYVDRNLASWSEPSIERQVNLITGTYALESASSSTDTTTGQPALVTATGPKESAVTKGMSEALYDHGIPIGSLCYAWKKSSSIDNTNTDWHWLAKIWSTDTETALDSSGELRAAGPGTGTVTATTEKTFAAVQLYYGVDFALNFVYSIFWTVLAVYGTHGLTKRGTASATEAQGFYASDVIRDIVSRHCPLLDTSGIEATTYPINQLAFHDPITPYDAIKQVNGFHQYELAVWDNKVFSFTQPTPLDDWDWEVRLDDAGTTANLQGDSIEDLANGIVVRYTDLIKGTEQVLTPETHTELADTTETNPANLAGIEKWTEVQVPYPTVEADALQIGRARLGEFSRPKAPGELSTGGHVRDRNGNWQPGSRVRAGQRVVISDHPNDAPRRITEVQWDDQDKSLRITTDNASQRLEGMFARVLQARAAAGVG